MVKENLILVHSFPTNSILLAPLIDYLQEYFNVYPVDLPGFVNNVEPLEGITLQGYSKYLDAKIKELNLSHYVIGGISFGFIVVNNAKLDEGCKAIMAIEPYLNTYHLRFGYLDRIKEIAQLRFVRLFGLYSFIWKTGWWKHYYSHIAHAPAERTEVVLKEIDPKTFFETGRQLLEYRGIPELKDLPYVLIINPADRTITSPKIIKFFEERVPDKLLVIKTEIGHYPRNMCKAYFADKLTKREIDRVYSFLGK